MKKDIRNLLIRLQESKSSKERRSLRKRLRGLGHHGGLNGKTIKLRKPKKLTPKEVQRITKHNREVTRRIESGEYKPFQKGARKCRR